MIQMNPSRNTCIGIAWHFSRGQGKRRTRITLRRNSREGNCRWALSRRAKTLGRSGWERIAHAAMDPIAQVPSTIAKVAWYVLREKFSLLQFTVNCRRSRYDGRSYSTFADGVAGSLAPATAKVSKTDSLKTIAGHRCRLFLEHIKTPSGSESTAGDLQVWATTDIAYDKDYTTRSRTSLRKVALTNSRTRRN